LEIRDYPGTLESFVNAFIGKFLEDESKSRLIYTVRSLRNYLNRGDTWRFFIPLEKPITFKKNDNLQVDFSCEIEGLGNALKIHKIQLRVWCLDEGHCYREGVDHPKIREDLDKYGWKRVILRFHFELKPEGEQIEPLYHLQVGGTNRMSDEFCWIPEDIEVPRFPYQPTDIILLSEFVLINFFQTQYREIREKPEWIQYVKKSQGFFQKSYFENCLRHLNDDRETLMGNLISHTG
jgi:hypothetical protein